MPQAIKNAAVAQVRSIQRILSRNKKQFLAYNQAKQQLFRELAPKDCGVILDLLPWLLSVNHPRCPGYVKNLDTWFRVYTDDNFKSVRGHEKEFKKRFGFREQGTLVQPAGRFCLIEGLYTIGSVGSVAQTNASDCDIWICIDRKLYDLKSHQALTYKVNLIRDWLDSELKIPVYFFICDVADVRNCRFGQLDQESSGTAQQNVLKEEFYRTCMVICGKIPLWWVTWDHQLQFTYSQALDVLKDDDFWEYDLIDFGDALPIEAGEYQGAALWQFHKSLSYPLKSIIKMALLKILLETPQEDSLCHQLRHRVMTTLGHQEFPDAAIFTMTRTLSIYDLSNPVWAEFLLECFYIRCDFNPYDRRQPIKNAIVRRFLKRRYIHRERQTHLRRCHAWRYSEQIELGEKLFKLLLDMYRDMAKRMQGLGSDADQRDLTVLSRRVAARYQHRRYKVPLLRKPADTLNIPNLTFAIQNGRWVVFAGNDDRNPLIQGIDISLPVAFVVWNQIFDAGRLTMRPNPSNVTRNEIVSLGTRMEQFFGAHATQAIELAQYLAPSRVIKILVVVGGDKPAWPQKEAQRFCVIYMNNWREMFVRVFKTPKALEAFFADPLFDESYSPQVSFFLQRSAHAYEKTIAHTKQALCARFAIDPHQV